MKSSISVFPYIHVGHRENLVMAARAESNDLPEMKLNPWCRMSSLEMSLKDIEIPGDSSLNDFRSITPPVKKGVTAKSCFF